MKGILCVGSLALAMELILNERNPLRDLIGFGRGAGPERILHVLPLTWLMGFSPEEGLHTSAMNQGMAWQREASGTTINYQVTSNDQRVMSNEHMSTQ